MCVGCQSIVPDGHGGTLVGGNIDVHDVALDPSRVAFKLINDQLSAHATLVPLLKTAPPREMP